MSKSVWNKKRRSSLSKRRPLSKSLRLRRQVRESRQMSINQQWPLTLQKLGEDRRCNPERSSKWMLSRLSKLRTMFNKRSSRPRFKAQLDSRCKARPSAVAPRKRGSKVEAKSLSLTRLLKVAVLNSQSTSMLLHFAIVHKWFQAVRKARVGSRGRTRLSSPEGLIPIHETSLRTSLVQPTLTLRRISFRLKSLRQLTKTQLAMLLKPCL